MTALFFDTNIGCYNTENNAWDLSDEGHVSLIARIRNLFQ